MLDLASETIEDEKIDDLVGTLFQRAHIQDKAEITFADFKDFLGNYRDELNFASLNIQCRLRYT